MGLFDDFGGGLMGAGSGAVTGGMLGGWPGAAIGAGLGGVMGFMGSNSAHSAANAQRQALDDAMKRLQQFSIQQQQNRQQDLQNTMAFYGPAQNYLRSIYSQGAPGPTMPTLPSLKGGIGG